MENLNKDLILRINNLEIAFGNKTLFDKADLLIHKEDKITLLGQNGVGKTTLVKAISNSIDYYGDIELNSDFKFAIMEQEKSFDNCSKTFTDYLEDKKNLLLDKLSVLTDKFADPNIYDDTQAYEKLIEESSKLQSRSETNVDEIKIKEILYELEFEMQDYKKEISTLSGGQKIKLRIAEVLSRDADFFILDEPTNHLDFNSINWLEEKIKESNKTFLIISHDRTFVNTISYN